MARVKRCDQCGNSICLSSSADDFCDAACYIRWLVVTGRVTRRRAIGYVKCRLQGLPTAALIP